MQTLQEYKCPCCGGAIAFDSTLQKMKCPFCDTEFEMETLADYDSVLKNEASDDMSWERAPPEPSGRKEKQTDFAPMYASPAAVKLWATKTRRPPPVRSAATLL